MAETKCALIIANYRYEYPDLRQLVAPAEDAESLATVLADPRIGSFDVRTLVNEPSHKVSLEIESFCDNRKRDDLLLLYFSGHGIKAADGQLYFATVDTQLIQHNVRRSTAVAAHFVNEVMSRSRSRRQILLLDCCYSGAFKEGMLAKGDERVGVGEQLQGQGRVVLTASDALQYSFEGEQVQGEGVRSVFTTALVHGLETGEADLDRDGSYSLDEVYDYVYARVSDERPEQKPTKMGYVEGKIFIGHNPHPQAGELPPELRESLEDRRQWVRLGAVQELQKLLGANNSGLILAAQNALSFLAKEDDSLQVRAAAEKCMAALPTQEKQEAVRIADGAEAQRKAEAERKSPRAGGAIKINWPWIAIPVGFLLLVFGIWKFVVPLITPTHDAESGSPGQVGPQPNPTPKVPTGGEITGSVMLDGTPRQMNPINMAADPDCAIRNSTPAMTQDVVPGENGTLQNVVVYIKGDFSQYRFDTPKDSFTIDQRRCQYYPHVLALRIGQPLLVVNSDPITHNVHPIPRENREWNESQPPGAAPINQSFPREEIAIPVKCNVHPWMKSYIAVFANPYFAVTGKDGSFELKNVPPGTYTLSAWHEVYGATEQSVTLAAGGSQKVTLTFNATSGTRP